MLEKKVLDLLNQELDNANTEKESASIRKILQKKPEAKKYYDDLREMSLMFRRIKDVPAPAHLKERILRALPLPEPLRAARPSPFKTFLRDFTANTQYRLALTFAGGVVAGILLFVVFSSPPADSTNLMGTMASNQPVVLAEAKADISLDGAVGVIQAKRFKSTIVAEINLQTSKEVDVVINYDHQQMKFRTFEPIGDAEGTLVVLEGQLRLSVSGLQKYELSFTDVPESVPMITARLFDRGILLTEYNLSFEQKTN